MSRRRGTNRLRLWARRKRIYYRQSWLLAVKDLAKLTVAVGGVLLLVGATVGTGVAMIDATGESAADWVDGTGNGDAESSNPGGSDPVSSTPTEATQGNNINESRVEQRIFERVNEIRVSKGLEPLEYDPKVASTARAHAVDMGTRDYFNHTSLEGETQEQRYSFCNGGENIAKTYVDRRVVVSDGTARYSDWRELTDGLVTQWMNSKPHRENGILGEWWSLTGVGVHINQGEVYAVQGFCAEK